MTTLRDSIDALVRSFASDLLDAVRCASPEDILAETSGALRTGRRRASSLKRLPRRSARDIAVVTEGIVALVKKHPKGLRAGRIRAELGISKKEWMRPLGAALSSKKLRKKGQKRSTTYFV